jgi:protein-L-isoaspartate(D-aspartate) O-methyltransferase
VADLVLFRRGYVATPSDDPVYLYQDVLVGLIPEPNLNNGEPAGHAMLIACADAHAIRVAGSR